MSQSTLRSDVIQNEPGRRAARVRGPPLQSPCAIRAGARAILAWLASAADRGLSLARVRSCSARLHHSASNSDLSSPWRPGPLRSAAWLRLWAAMGSIDRLARSPDPDPPVHCTVISLSPVRQGIAVSAGVEAVVASRVDRRLLAPLAPGLCESRQPASLSCPTCPRSSRVARGVD